MYKLLVVRGLDTTVEILDKIKKTGCECIICDDKDAFDIIKFAAFDAVISSYYCEHFKNGELLAYVRLKSMDVPFIYISKINSSNIILEAFKKGASDFISYPCTADEINLVIKNNLMRKKINGIRTRLILDSGEKAEELETIKEEQLYDMLGTLINVMEAKDTYTTGHCRRVADYSAMIAKALGLTPEMSEKIYISSLLHDIGKIGVPESILQKPGKLTFEEYEIVKKHPELGYNILKPVIKDEFILKGVLQHHERIDGKGYPDALCGRDIALSARIISIADSYDAMTSNRVYRQRLSNEAILNELVLNTGKQFDERASQAFMKAINLSA